MNSLKINFPLTKLAVIELFLVIKLILIRQRVREGGMGGVGMGST